MRYVIGIDLGTTNTCVSYVDTQHPQMPIHILRIPQLINAGYVNDLKTLSSCCYLASEHEWMLDALKLPWKSPQDYFTGVFAKEQGAKVPTKLVHSAKSWLCHAAAGRRDKILPFESTNDSQRISALEASSRYLMHIREAWNYLMSKGDLDNEFDQQEIILTVPASFDEIARSLTVEAAKIAGYKHMTLLEEPQAAFYSWISQHENKWIKDLNKGAYILVCDVGGGTTDFSLIEVVETNGHVGFQRLSVGDHLLLGGDNMDVALAHFIEAKLSKEGWQDMTPFQWLQIRHQAREAKEALLDSKGEDLKQIVIQNSGSHVIQNTLTTMLNKKEVEHLLMEGFWKTYQWEEAIQAPKKSGFRSIGLPYEEEPSITKHLARFLKQSVHPTKGLMKPDYILFNGGALKPTIFQGAVISSLRTWFPDKSPQVLQSYSLDLAVSRGAAYYGKVRRGFGVRIEGGSSRGYYFAVEIKNASNIETKAMTLLPRGSQEGSNYEIDHTFWLQPNTPVAFRLYSSHIRLYDKVGELVEIDSQEMQLLPPVQTILRFGKGSILDANKEKIPARLEITLTAIGTLELWVKSLKSEHRWRLEFQLRKESGQDDSLATLDSARHDETFDTAFLKQAKEIIKVFYTEEGTYKSSQIMDLLEHQLERPRRDWSLSILRGLWDELILHALKRKTSQEKEGRWWNLAGFFLRPGFGFPMDDFRIKELWKVILTDYKREYSNEVKIQFFICFRRIAAGLNKGQQMQIASDLIANLYTKGNEKIEIKNKSELYFYQEKIRALAAMELIEMPLKIKLGQGVINRMRAGLAMPAELWSLGRIGARHLSYGSLANVISRDVCSRWLEELLQISHLNKDDLAFLFGQLARKTVLRELNIPGIILDKIIKIYDNDPHRDRLQSLLYEEGNLTAEEQNRVFGEQLPLGISIDSPVKP
jgi:molecular chaperone DnaK (HSP70)